MIVLPSHARRAWVKAFALALALWMGLGVALIAAVVTDARPSAPAAALAVSVAMLVGTGGVACPAAVVPVYRLWRRVSRFYARSARFALLALCYAIVLVAVGAAGSSLRLRRPAPGDSLWGVRRTQSPSTYRSQFEGVGLPWTGRPWRAVVAWALLPHNAWAIFLLPLFLALSALVTEEQAPYPAGIYTLF